MKDKDLLQRFIFDTVPIRGEYIYLTQSYQTILNQHNYPSPIRQLLGEALCVAGLLSAIIKFKGRLSVQFRGKGNLKLLLAQCDHQFNIRGLVKWEGNLSSNDLLQAFTQGVLMIMLDMNNKQNAYQGIVNWQGNSLATSIEGYFRDSEQLATKLWLHVTDDEASGLLLQLMPGAEKDQPSIELAANNENFKRIVELTNMVDRQELLTSNLETLLTKLYPEDAIRIFPVNTVRFKCTCSRERSENAIYILGKEEAAAELKNKQSIVVTCEFCNKEYIFDRVDVDKIFKERDAQSKQMH